MIIYIYIYDQVGGFKLIILNLKPPTWLLEIIPLPRLGFCKKPTLYINLNVL